MDSQIKFSLLYIYISFEIQLHISLEKSIQIYEGTISSKTEEGLQKNLDAGD